MTHDGREFAVATDGWMLVAVQRDHVVGELPPVPERVQKLAADWVTTAPADATVLPCAQLRAFSGAYTVPPACDTCNNEREIECVDCDGEGSHECECMNCGDVHRVDCKVCKGDGRRKCPDCSDTPDDKPGRLLSATINRELLAGVLRTIEPDDATSIAIAVVRITKTIKHDAYLIRPVDDGRWMALVMAMAPHVKPTADFARPETWRKACPVTR